MYRGRVGELIQCEREDLPVLEQFRLASYIGELLAFPTARTTTKSTASHRRSGGCREGRDQDTASYAKSEAAGGTLWPRW